jgi:hypothetical protein
MVWAGLGGGNTMDVFTMTVSHELAETISDPGGIASNPSQSYGVVVTPPAGLPRVILTGPPGSPGYPTPVYGSVDQIGDYEPAPPSQAHYGFRLNGVMVQPYWSQADNAFIVPDQTWSANQQKIVLQPVWNGSSFPTQQYDLFAMAALNGSTIPTFSVNALKTQATLGSETVTFDFGTIRNVSNYVVYGGIEAKYIALANETTFTGGTAQLGLGLPTSGEQVVYSRTGQGLGVVRHFQGGDIYWSWSTGQADVVYGAIGAKYASLGGAAVFGLPTSDELPWSGQPGGRVSHFQRGDIYWSPATGAVAVPHTLPGLHLL